MEMWGHPHFTFILTSQHPSSRNPDVGFGISAGAKKVRARLGTDHRLPCLAVADKKRSASLREATTPQTAKKWELMLLEWTEMMGKYTTTKTPSFCTAAVPSRLAISPKIS